MFSVFCKLTNSSKVRRILLIYTFVAESFGLAITNRGGKLSLGPPLGGTILAQELAKNIIAKPRTTQLMRAIRVKNFFMRDANLQAFSLALCRLSQKSC